MPAFTNKEIQKFFKNSMILNMIMSFKSPSHALNFFDYNL